MPRREIGVLLVEDDPDDALIIDELLREHGNGIHYRLNRVDRLEAALSTYTEGSHDVILLDLGLPDSQGLEAVKQVHKAKPEAAIVVLTGLDEEAFGAQALHWGAQDYLSKRQLEGNLLCHTLRYAIEHNRIRIELARRNAELSVLHRISAAASQTLDLDELFVAVGEALQDLWLFGIVPDVRILVAEDDGLRPAYWIGRKPPCATIDRVELGQRLCGVVAKTGALTISSRDCEPIHEQRPSFLDHADIAIPMQTKDRLAGVLCLSIAADARVDPQRERLLISIGNAIAMAIENARLYERTRQLALEDALTGLGNRRFMDIMLDKHTALAAREQTPLAAIMLDVDNFKRYNDTYGHEAGDRIIAGLGSVIAKEVRTGDFAARYGGEEFLVLLPDTNIEEARGLAERLRAAVEHTLGVTVSLGVAACNPGAHKEALVRQADAALYRAKRAGKNRVTLA